MDTIFQKASIKLRTQMNRDPLSRQAFPHETHAVRLSPQDPYRWSSYNYMGPGTHLMARLRRGDPPINSADAAAQEHDMIYYLIPRLPLERQKEAEVWADRRAIYKWQHGPDAQLPEVQLAINALVAKMVGQATGKIPWGMFLTTQDRDTYPVDLGEEPTPEEEMQWFGRRLPRTRANSHITE